ncbi:unnamed protein product [Tuber aestivum]|uniref:Mediator of RNA polymerase II transcription subunit 13 n=1 Tax=Tuber aestivum TaxID=59557 RepID=A0A292PZH6_9PEZI|nr:unnamed protein product [Tuber aestivum]
MESPESCLTNVFKIENLSRIPYVLYRNPPPSTSHSIRHAERTLRSEGHIVLGDRESNALWVFQIECFSNGAPRGDGGGGEGGESHVEGEVQAQIAEESTEGKWKSLEKRIGEEWGLTESSAGVFLAASLASSTKGGGDTFSPVQLGRSTPVTPALPTPRPGIFSPPPQDVATIDLTDDPLEEPKEDRLLPYKQFLAAVLSSISFNLSLHSGYTSLNIRTLVSPSSLVPRVTELKEDKEDLLPSSPITLPGLLRPSVLALEAYLTTSGTLLVTPHTHVQAALRRVSSSLSSPLDKRDVFIAPWGEWGRLVSEEGLKIGAREERWKTSVREYLQDCGILSAPNRQWGEKSVLEEAIDEGRWRRVEIWVPIKDHPSEGMGMLVNILWPDALLFLRTSESDTNGLRSEGEGEDCDAFWGKVFDAPEYARFASGRLSRSLAVGLKGKRELGTEWWDIPSAVDWAEEWMEGKEDREKVVMARREEKRLRQEQERIKREAEAEKEQQSKASEPVLDVKEEANVKGKLKVLDEAKKDGLVAGGNAGVYPTPPDGGQQQQQQQQPPQQLPGPSVNPGSGAPNTTSNATSTTVATDMDLDWIGVMPDAVPGPVRKQSDATGGVALAGGTGEADLFGGDMDEDMFGEGVTEDDFAFFDNNPGQLEGFGGGGSAGDVDMGLDVDFGGGGTVDLAMESPEVAMKEDILTLVNTPGMPIQRIDQSAEESRPAEPSASDKTEPHIQTPPLSPRGAFRLLVPDYASNPTRSSQHLTPPTTVSAMKTPQKNGGYAPLSGGVSEAKRRMSLYSPITFTTKVEMADRKYAPGGRFFLPESTKEKEQKELEKEQNITTIGLKRKRAGSMFMRSMVVEEAPVPEVAEVVLGDEDAVMDDSDGAVGEREDESEFYSGDETSSESDADDETDEEEEEPGGGAYYTSPVAMAYGGSIARRKRKRAYEDEDQEMELAPPISDSTKRDVAVGADGEVEVPGEMAPPPWEVMIPDTTESNLVGIFSNISLETEAISLAGLGDNEFAAVSRLVRDQIVYGTTKPLGDLMEVSGVETTVEDDDEEWCAIRQRRGKDEGVVEDAVKSLFGKTGVARCTLETYVAIADAVIEPPPLLGRAAAMRPIPQPRRGGIASALAKRPEVEVNTAVFKLPPPHVHIHRAESALEILPPALHFWETFGFGPCSGAKNVIAFCLHPDSRSMEEAADAFLERVSGAYESGRYGVHVRAKLDEVVENGGYGVQGRDIKAVIEAMEDFGSVLASVADEGCNIVVYVVNPFEHPSALVDICVGFSKMKKVYESRLGGIKGNNLVLQVVRASFLARKMGAVGTGQAEWARLAAEVYNRCAPSDGVSSLEEV